MLASMSHTDALFCHEKAGSDIFLREAFKKAYLLQGSVGAAASVQFIPGVVLWVHIVQSQSTQPSTNSDENKPEDTFQTH